MKNDRIFQHAPYQVKERLLGNSTFLKVIEKVPRQGVIIPSLVERSVEMKLFQDTQVGYKLFAGTYILPSASASTEFKVTNGDVEDDFRNTGILAETCVS